MALPKPNGKFQKSNVFGSGPRGPGALVEDEGPWAHRLCLMAMGPGLIGSLYGSAVVSYYPGSCCSVQTYSCLRNSKQYLSSSQYESELHPCRNDG